MVSDRGSGTVTADDVAELAGVSRWTVNRAFKKDASISEKAREKVMAAAEELGYAPNLMAASLASNKSNFITLLIDDFANPHKLVMMERLTRILRNHGWDTILVNTRDDEDTTKALLQASQRRVDAAVLIGSKFDDQVLTTARGAHRVRKLILFARYSNNPNTISVCVDDRAAMEEIGNYVLDKGYQKPAFIAGPQTTSAHLLRKETFLSLWLKKRGEVPEFTPVERYDPGLAFGHISQYLANRENNAMPDILVCENDALAMGAMDAVRHVFGLRVPEDIAVVGFDDLSEASNPNYLLTTYRQPLSAMAEGLVTVLNGTANLEDLSKFTGKMVIRESA